MKTVNVDVMSYESPGDGNSYEDEIEIKDKEYLLLRSYFRIHDCDDIHSEDIEDEMIKAIVEKIECEASGNLEENSCDGFEMIKENDEEEFEEWYENFTTSVQLIWETPEEHTFTINISNGGESELEFNVYEDELELIEQADDDGEEYENVEGLENFYKDVEEAVKTKLEEDLDLTGDDFSMLDNLQWSITLSD